MDDATAHLLEALEWEIGPDGPGQSTFEPGRGALSGGEVTGLRLASAEAGLDALAALGLVTGDEERAVRERMRAAARGPHPDRLTRRAARAARPRAEAWLASQGPDAPAAHEVLHDLWHVGAISERRLVRELERLAPAPVRTPPDAAVVAARAARDHGLGAVRSVPVPADRRGDILLLGLAVHAHGFDLTWEQPAGGPLAPPRLVEVTDDGGTRYVVDGGGASGGGDDREIHSAEVVPAVPAQASLLRLRFTPDVAFEVAL